MHISLQGIPKELAETLEQAGITAPETLRKAGKGRLAELGVDDTDMAFLDAIVRQETGSRIID